MRLIPFVTCAAGAVLLAACSSSPEFPQDPYAELYSDAPASAIPPSARERRAAQANGAIGQVPAQQPYQSAPTQPYRQPVQSQANAQVESELQAEYQARGQAFGNINQQQPRPIDLGGNPGLTRLAPYTGYDTTQPVFRAANDYDNTRGQSTRYYTQESGNVPSDAPPLPSSARSGECYVLVKQPTRYRNVSRRVQTSPETTTWRHNCTADDNVPNSTGQTACLVREPARYETVNEREVINDGGYEWRETPCRDQGNSGNVVRDLQRALDRAGYDPGPIDGIYGQLTRRAANAYQRDHGLPVTRNINNATLADLGVSRR